MIYSLRGTLTVAQPGMAVIECGGVGYRCAVSLQTHARLTVGRETLLYTHLAVREDAVDLFGFCDLRELESFRLLTGVSGVGPRVALTLLSDFTPDALAMAVASGDSKALTRSAGVGQKLASRIVLELRDKLGGIDREDGGMQKLARAVSPGGALSEAAAALGALGYSPSEAAAALSGCDESLPAEELIRYGLRQLSRPHDRR